MKIRNGILFTLIPAALLCFGLVGPVHSLTLYQTGFEPNDADGNNYQSGSSITDYSASGWDLQSGAAVIVTDPKQAGQQALKLDATSQGVILDRTVPYPSPVPSQVSTDIVWVQAYFRGPGSEVDPPVYPESPAASSIVHFSKTNGIQLLNGPKATATWVNSSVTGGNFDETHWYQVTLRQDYGKQEWDCYIDGAKQNTAALKFRDTVSKLNGFMNLADTTSYFDSLRVIAPVRGDANGDGLMDSADVVVAVMLANSASVPLDVMFGGNADVAGPLGQSTPDGVIDQFDVEAIADQILGL